MPIAVKDYSWDETETLVHVVVPLKGVKASKADIFSTDDYLKVNFPPYLFEVVLFEGVDDSKSAAQVGDGVITFTLQKKEAGLWNRLISINSDDKELMKSKRQAAIDAAHKKAQEETRRKAAEKQGRDRLALKEQMRLEEEERSRVEGVKESERQKATSDFEEWKLKELAAEKQLQMEEEETIKSSPRIMSDAADIFDTEDVEQAPVILNTRQGNNSKLTSGEGVPPPRSSASIQVTFTPRVFPTPLRESKVEAEEEWLRKQAEARRIPEIDDPDLSEEEKNPVWLKDKGDGFFKSGNYLAAVNAYNLAARLDSKMHAVYSNRATCHLKLRNFIKCIEDCSKALDLLTPPVDANAKSRLRAHVKRGTAFCELELYIQGLQDYEAGLKLDPKNEQLKADSDRIRTIIQSTVD
ncbi:dynein axonemal assembly factor 4-like [Asterias amurensis]|uniref:dynein axonemal assembly factor 4-like n=1 Tax=Asterias amurensis TaxID=7602 RepID=UPI003AB2F26D